MKTSLKAKAVAFMLTLATAGAMTISAPVSAQAGVLGSIKSAAKTVGGAIKTGASATAKVVNKVAKPVVKVTGKVTTPVYNGLRDRYGRPFYRTAKEIAKKF